MNRLRNRIRVPTHRRTFRATKRADKHAGLPRTLKPTTLYVVGAPSQWIIFLCPCDQGHDIALNIGNGVWRLAGGRRRPTIRPSINSHGIDRRCHFWITRGKVRWCGDTYRTVTGSGRS